MTTTSVQTSYTYNTEIHSTGKQKNTSGWVLAVTAPWRSDYPLQLYGQDWSQIEGFHAGQEVVVTIDRGSMKKDKIGDAPWDYFWNLRVMTRAGANWEDPRAMTPDPIPQPMPDPIPQPMPDPRRSKEECRFLDCLQIAAITSGNLTDAWAGALNLFDLVTQWEENRVRDLTGMPLEGPETVIAGSIFDEPTQTVPDLVDPVLYIDQKLKEFNAEVREGSRPEKEIRPSMLLRYIQHNYDVDPEVTSISGLVQTLQDGEVLSLASAIVQGRVQ